LSAIESLAAERPAVTRDAFSAVFRAFSEKVDSGFSEENAANQNARATSGMDPNSMRDARRSCRSLNAAAGEECAHQCAAPPARDARESNQAVKKSFAPERRAALRQRISVRRLLGAYQRRQRHRRQPHPRRQPQPLRHQALAGVAEVVKARVETPIVVATWVPMLPTAYVASTATTANPRITIALAVPRTFLIEVTFASFTFSLPLQHQN
jgi:hypothetical protein